LGPKFSFKLDARHVYYNTGILPVKRFFILSHSHTMRTAALFSLFLLAGAQPLEQSLTVEPVKDCSELPDYNPKTKIAGPWTINVDGCYNGTSSNSCSIEGFSTSADTTRQFGDEGYLNGLVSGHSPVANKHHNRPTNIPTDHRDQRKRQHQNSTPLQRQ
jgi:hypothetical protein